MIADHTEPPPAPPDIEIRWQRGLPTGEPAALRSAAIAADDEMGYSAALAGEVWRSDSAATASVYTHLRRHDIPAAPRGHLAAVLTVAPLGDGVGAADLLVAPAFRSMGVATSVVESLLRDAATAAPFERVLLCAYGSHPATSRIAARFGVMPAGSRTHLILPSRSDLDASRAVGMPRPGAVRTRLVRQGARPTPDEWSVFGEPVRDRIRIEVAGADDQAIGYADVSRTGEIGAVHDVRGPDGDPAAFDTAVQVVCQAVRYLADGGAAAVHTSVRSASGAEFDAFRAAAFQRDRTDLLFSGAPQAMRRRLRAHDVPE
ncbi:hypothetical protein [Rhodococcus sp. NPDC003348]